MWILEYQNTLANGQILHVSRCIKQATNYSLGRSGKCSFPIKNDKSISRNHVSIVWEGTTLHITNTGKVTAINGKYQKEQESFSCVVTDDIPLQKKENTISKQINISLGISPIEIKLLWIPLRVLIPRNVDLQLLDSLDEYGVRCIEERSLDLNSINNINLVLSSDELIDCKYYRDLFAYTNGIYEVQLTALKSIETWMNVTTINFIEKWKDEMNFNILGIINNNDDNLKEIRKVIAKVTFIIIGETDEAKKIYLENSIKMLHGTSKLYKNINDLRESLAKESLSEKIIIICPTDTTELETLSSLKLNVTTTREFVQCLKNTTFETLISSFLHLKLALAPAENPKSQTTASTIIENDGKSSNIHPIDDLQRDNPAPTKRRRIARPKIKPLNSLSFFAGGGELSSDAPNTTILAGNETVLPSMIDAIHSNHTTSHTTKVDENISEEFVKNKTQIPIDHSTLPNIVQSDEEQLNIEANDVYFENNKKLPIDIEDKNIVIDIPKDTPMNVLNQNCSHSEKDTSSASVSLASKRTLMERPRTLVDVIQATKSKEVERLKTDIAEVRPEELTEGAINEFANLEIEENSSLVVRRDMSRPESTPGPWQGRKNFKKFIKVCPSSRNTNDSIKNNAFLITRSYIVTRPYDSISKKQLGPNIDDSFDEVRENNRGNNSSIDSTKQPIDSDTEQKPITERNAPESIVSQSKKIEDSDSEGESNSFSFSRANMASNGLFVTNEDEEDEIDDIEDIEPQVNSDKVTEHSTRVRTHVSSRVQNLASTHDNSDSDSDSDDSDDGPNFKFRRMV